MSASQRVVKNTLILYGRMLLTIGVSLYSTRLILNSLGSTDFGIFSLLAGIILMLAFLNNAMSTSTQRYLSFHQGKGDVEMQKKVFFNSVILHFILGFLIVLILEVSSFFLFDGFLNIPDSRIAAGKVVFHFMVLSIFFTIIGVPFNGSLIAHENMMWVAVVNIVEALLKLFVAVLLSYYSGDRLVYYGILMSGVAFISLLMYASFCIIKYPECSINKEAKIENEMIKELASFAGWNMFGALCSVGKTQGLAVILNLFLGPVANAAYGISNQISTQMNFLSSTMLRAINPQIMKSEGSGNRDRMLRLSMIASKFGFYLLVILAVPCIVEMQQILEFWLKTVPEYTVVFSQLILCGILVNQLTIGLQSAIQATGKIKKYQFVVGTTLLLNIPLAYLLLRFGIKAQYVLVSGIFIEFIGCCLRLYFANRNSGLNIKEYFQQVILYEIMPTICIAVVAYITSIHFDFRFSFILTFIVSGFFFIISVYFFGINNDEKSSINRILNKI